MTIQATNTNDTIRTQVLDDYNSSFNHKSMRAEDSRKYSHLQLKLNNKERRENSSVAPGINTTKDSGKTENEFSSTDQSSNCGSDVASTIAKFAKTGMEESVSINAIYSSDANHAEDLKNILYPDGKVGPSPTYATNTVGKNAKTDLSFDCSNESYTKETPPLNMQDTGGTSIPNVDEDEVIELDDPSTKSGINVHSTAFKDDTVFSITKAGYDNLGYLSDSAVNGKYVREEMKRRKNEIEPSPEDVFKKHKRYRKRRSTTRTIKSIKESEIDVEIEIGLGPKIGKELKLTLSVCNFLMTIFVTGVLYAQGVLIVSIIDGFRVTRTEASPVVSVFAAIVFGGGGVVGPLMNRFNGGSLCMIGAVFGSAGFIISSFAPSIPVLVLSMGVMAGVGLTVPFILPFIAASDMYDKHRFTMLTIISLCPGIGGVVFPYMTSVLIDIYGWRGVVLIYGALFLNCFPVGYLNAIVKRRLSKKLGQRTNLKEMLNCSLFREPLYLVLVFCVFLMNTLLPTVNVFFVDMVRGKGFDVETGSFLLSVNGITNLGGRLIIIALTPVLKCSRVAQWSVYLAILSAAVCLYAFVVSYPHLLATTIVYGTFWGMAMISYPAMILEVSGPKNYPTAMGYSNLIGAIGGLIGVPIAGFIKDTTGNYDLVYFGTTVLGLVGSAMLLTMYIKTTCQKRREEKVNHPVFKNTFTYISS
ncbi:monocarboxylate transporter 13 isoform X2 [Patella vulgata]|uniref:monocarboxylate transporter 13 isoform X2 n=1 Tax=Patella vulgata TaxID=6465 RepID=UPI00217FFFC6|nr:monocarboxylate transporter 13 isoform X2 [Patella vulgata]